MQDPTVESLKQMFGMGDAPPQKPCKECVRKQESIIRLEFELLVSKTESQKLRAIIKKLKEVINERG